MMTTRPSPDGSITTISQPRVTLEGSQKSKQIFNPYQPPKHIKLRPGLHSVTTVSGSTTSESTASRTHRCLWGGGGHRHQEYPEKEYNSLRLAKCCNCGTDHPPPPPKKSTEMYPKVSGLAAWSENCKWYSSLPVGAVA
jgi:hypothetical protein